MARTALARTARLVALDPDGSRRFPSGGERQREVGASTMPSGRSTASVRGATTASKEDEDEQRGNLVVGEKEARSRGAKVTEAEGQRRTGT